LNNKVSSTWLNGCDRDEKVGEVLDYKVFATVGVFLNDCLVMKFLITENKLNNLIFIYLDNKDFFIRETPTNYYFLEDSKNNMFASINVRKKDNICFIYPGLVEEISVFFSISSEMSTDIILNYAESKLNNESTSLSLKLYGDN